MGGGSAGAVMARKLPDAPAVVQAHLRLSPPRSGVAHNMIRLRGHVASRTNRFCAQHFYVRLGVTNAHFGTALCVAPFGLAAGVGLHGGLSATLSSGRVELTDGDTPGVRAQRHPRDSDAAAFGLSKMNDSLTPGISDLGAMGAHLTSVELPE